MRAILILLLLLTTSFSSQAADTVDISKYKGKVVYLDFWASWCIPCRKSFPWMNSMQTKYGKDKLVIVAVNLDKEHQLAVDFLKKNPADFKIAYDPEGNLAKKYQIKGMPSSIIFDTNGKAIYAHSGFFKKKIPQYEQHLKSVINPLIKE